MPTIDDMKPLDCIRNTFFTSVETHLARTRDVNRTRPSGRATVAPSWQPGDRPLGLPLFFRSEPSVTTQTTDLHEERLERVFAVLKGSGARRVLDLGCGSGSLLHRLLADDQFEEVVGVEQSGLSLAQARTRLGRHLAGMAPRLRLHCASYERRNPGLAGFEAAAMVETIEHVRPEALSRVEQAVFGQYRPALVFMTTPNREYNPLYDLDPGELRDPDHKFEWDRAKFRAWAAGVAGRNGYRVRFGGIGEGHPDLGEPTQTACFTLEPLPGA